MSSDGKSDMTVTKSNGMNTEMPCSLDCGAAGNCYLEQEKNDDVQNCQDDNCLANGVKQDHGGTSGLRQRCQCPLGRSGDRCELGKFYALVKKLAYVRSEHVEQIVKKRGK